MVSFCVFVLTNTNGYCRYSNEDPPTLKERSLAWGIEADMNSKYLWRGINYNDGLVLQPNLWLGWGDFSVGLWGSMTVYDRYQEVHRNELDLVMNYFYSLGKLEMEHSAMFYYYLGQDDSPPTGELYVGIGYPIGDFKLLSSATVDFLAYPGACFFEHGFAYEKNLNDRLTWTSSLVVGWANGKFNETYVGTETTSANLIGVRIELTYSSAGSFYFKPHIELNRIIDKGLVPYLGKYPWYGGLLIGIEI